MKKEVWDNIVFVLVAHLCFLAEPAIVFAQNSNYDPINFTQPLNVAKGSVIPKSEEAFYLSDEETCSLVVTEFGWDRSGCDAIDRMIFGLTPEIDSVIFEKPVSDGYVSLSDWDENSSSSEIAAIEDSYKQSIRAQSERLGQEIKFDGWLLYPTVDRDRKILYYANILSWSGSRTVNISVSYFDRHGYVPIKIVTMDSELPSEAVRGVVAAATASYKPKAETDYAQFVSGDKVASYGALGVLATMLGVKYGKAATAGLLAIALVVLKKLWFLAFLPFVWLGSLFRRRSS